MIFHFQMKSHLALMGEKKKDLFFHLKLLKQDS